MTYGEKRRSWWQVDPAPQSLRLRHTHRVASRFPLICETAMSDTRSAGWTPVQKTFHSLVYKRPCDLRGCTFASTSTRYCQLANRCACASSWQRAPHPSPPVPGLFQPSKPRRQKHCAPSRSPGPAAAVALALTSRTVARLTSRIPTTQRILTRSTPVVLALSIVFRTE